MTRLSRRIVGITGESADDGWGILGRARALQAEGAEVVQLAMGDHDFTTAAPIVDAAKAALDAGYHHYAPIRGIPPLREAIAARAQGVMGLDVAPDEVCLTFGGQAGLYASMAATLDPGDEAIIVEPYYATYDQTIRAAGGVPVIVTVRAEDGFQPRAADIEAAVTPRTRAILLNSPNNPSGAVYTRETLEGIADLAARHDLWVISDEVYATQVHEGTHISIASLPGMRARCLVLDSMSKSHAMTGWRVGWVISPDAAVAGRIADHFLVSTYGAPGFIQRAALAGLTMADSGETAIAARYRRRRDIAVAALSASSRLRVSRPAGAMYVMIDLRGFEASGERFATALLEAEHIAVTPGESFGAATAGHLRMSLCAEDRVLEDACVRLARFADEWDKS